MARSAQCNICRGLGQFFPEAALIELGDDTALQLIAFIEEAESKREAHIPENGGVLRPGDDCPRTHDRGKIAVDEGVAGKFSDPNHVAHRSAALLGLITFHLREHDVHLVLVWKVIQGHDNGPAVHLTLVDLLRAVAEHRRIAEADRIRRREQPESWVRPDHAALIEKRKLSLHFEHALDYKHHVRTARVIFVKHKSGIGLQCPRQNALAKLGYLLAVADNDGVFSHEVDAAHVAVEVDTDA